MKDFSIMIVDDDEVDRYLLKRKLKGFSGLVEIFEIKDGEEAIDFHKNYVVNKEIYGDNFPPLIIFLDINMPRMNGHEYLGEYSKLREENSHINSVVVMFTTSTHEMDVQEAMKYDFVESYLVKGDFTSEQLHEQIENALQNK